MKHFRKIWDEEKHNWMLTHKNKDRRANYADFLKAFPDADVTFTAFCNERSRIGASPHIKHGSTKSRPLFSEHEKKGFVFIKVGQPSVWIPKARWVYEQAHPEYKFDGKDNFMFLNGDTRDFRPENIEVLPKRLAGVFNQINKGCKEPETVRLNILMAKLKQAQLDAGEKAGMVVKQGNGRKFKDEVNEYARKLNSSPERRAMLRAKSRERNRNLTAEQRERKRMLHREWYRKNKGGKK